MNEPNPPAAPSWSAVKTLFERLVDLPVANRAALLRVEHAATAAAVWQLLAQHDAEERSGGHFLALPAALPAPAEVDRRGQRLGPWELGAPLGRGGMGEVWEARRADCAYDARVAVKVLRSGR